MKYDVIERFEREARPLVKIFAPLYVWTRGFCGLFIRVTLGGLSLFHVWPKLVGAFPITRPAGILSRLGIEPAVVFSYVIFGIEFFCGICLILGLFTRLWAAAAAIELAGDSVFSKINSPEVGAFPHAIPGLSNLRPRNG
jgi:uncharacterized membrane protein YphA (DoxX/SURF4 family)